MLRFIIAATYLLILGCAQNNNTLQIELISSQSVSDTTQYAQCHASTLLEVKDGLLMAYFGGAYERHPNVSIYTTRFKNEAWGKPVKVADGFKNDTLSYPTWNPVLFRNPGGRIDLYYKVGPSPNSWWGMVMHSFDEGITWSEPEKLPAGILGPIRNKPVQLKSGVILSPSSTEPSHEIWKSHIERSIDGGQTWNKIDIPSHDSVKIIQPTLLIYPDTGVQALLRSNQNVIMQSWSYDEGESWTEAKATDVLHPNSGIDAITLKTGEILLINNPIKSGESWEAGRNKLDLYYSENGINWNNIFHLENQPEGEFSYPCIIQTEDGTVHISYTHNRTAIKHVALKVIR